MNGFGVGPDWYFVEAPQEDPVLQQYFSSLAAGWDPPGEFLPTDHLFQAFAHKSSPIELFPVTAHNPD